MDDEILDNGGKISVGIADLSKESECVKHYLLIAKPSSYR